MKNTTSKAVIRAAGHARMAHLIAATLLAVTLAACSSKGGGGSSQFVQAPNAIATPVGYSPTSNKGVNPVTFTVRSGADVALTGEDSDGGGISITGFSWAQTDSAPTPQVKLIYRNNSTVTFTAPSVAASTVLNFKLSVTNALGTTGTASAQVTVVPASDPNRFLSLLSTQHHFRVAVGFAQAGSAAGTPVTLATDTPVCVQLQSAISYLARGGTRTTFALPTQQVDAKWLAGGFPNGGGGGVVGFPSPSPTTGKPYLAFRNPVVSFELPVLNDDLIFAAHNQPGATQTDISNQLVTADMDQAYVQMSVIAQPGSCDSTVTWSSALSQLGLQLQLQDENGNPIGESQAGAAAAPLTVSSSSVIYGFLGSLSALPLPDGSSNLTPDDIARASAYVTTPAMPSPLETRESAAAYYKAIDPNNQKTTLQSWMSQNGCFDYNNINYGAGEAGFDVTHAQYTNNFDLGFGRDMYFARCPNGNLESVVINYPSLGATANRIGAFLAVAMEYSPPASGSTAQCFATPAQPATNTGACSTKFLIFAPDDRTGQYMRVMSANFDRRGQKYVPGACTVCHGGAPGFVPGSPTYPDGPRPHVAGNSGDAGDVDATFLPWDQGSLLFSDSDPAFPCNVSTTAPACQSVNAANYTLAAQKANIKALNGLAWETYLDPGTADTTGYNEATRFQAPLALLTKWYFPAGTATNPSPTTSTQDFDDSTTPADWPNGSTAPADLYHQVFAHYCRSCHTEQNVADPTEAHALNIQQFTNFHKALTLHADSMQQLVFSNNQMPLSRLSDDRFWVDYNHGTSAAQLLGQYINTTSTTDPTVAAVATAAGGMSAAVVPPGQPVVSAIVLPANGINVTGAINNPLVPTSSGTLTRFMGSTVDGLSQTLFVANYQWSLSCVSGPCTASTPGLIGTPAASDTNAQRSGASLPAFPTDAAGNYQLTLTATSGLVGATPVSYAYPFTVSQSAPPALIAGSCTPGEAAASATMITVDLSGCFQSLGDAGPSGYQLQVASSGAGPYASQTSSGWTAVVAGTGGSGVDGTNGQNSTLPTVSVTFPANTTPSAQLYFRLCDFDAVCTAPGLVSVLGVPAVQEINLLAYWDPAVNPNYSAGTFGSLVGLPISCQLYVSSPPVASHCATLLPQAATGPLVTLLGSGSIGTFGASIVAAPTSSLTIDQPSSGGYFSVGQNTGATSTSVTTTVGQLSSTPSPNGVFFTPYLPSGNFVTACVPAAVSCSGSGISNPITFSYTVQSGTLTPQSQPTNTIAIQALTSFQTGSASVMSVLTMGTVGCDACHSASAYTSNPALATTYWNYTSGQPGTTYASIKGGIADTTAADLNPGTTVPAANTPLIVPGNPAASTFYTSACLGTDSAGNVIPGMLLGGNPYFAVTGTQCQILYQWILEGAPFD